MKTQYAIILICVLFSIYFVFDISYKTQNARENLNKLKEEIIQNENHVHVLKVEWSYLTNPERIKRLTEKHLNLKLQTVENVKSTQTQVVFNEQKNKQ